MRLFESDNLWKRRRREQARADRPDTPENRALAAGEQWRSQLLWLLGAGGLLALGLVGLALKVVAAEPITVGFLVILALYVAVSVPPAKQAYRAWKDLEGNG